MSVQLTPQIEAIIRQKVATGSYTDADAVVGEALRLLNERDDRVRWLRNALIEGEQGEAVPVTPELLEELHRSAMRRANAGEHPSPDVCP